MKHLILLVDALGYDSITKKRMPQLYNIFRGGYFGPLRTLLGYSNGIIPSIFSGKYQDEHGIWGIFKLSPSTSPFNGAAFYPSFIFDRNLLTRYFANRMIFRRCKKLDLIPSGFGTPNIPIKILKNFDVSVKNHIIEPNSMGKIPTLFDLMRQNNIEFKYVGYPWHKGSKEILDMAEEQLQKKQVVFAYIDTIDHDGHAYGIKSKEFLKRLRLFDVMCADFLRRIMKTEDISITMFADHGMKNVNGIVDVKGAIDSTSLKIGEDFIPFLDSTMARFKTLTENAREILTKTLQGIQGGRVLTNEDLTKYRINFPSREYGDLIFLADPGKLILPNYYTVLKRSEKEIFGRGMHGWDPDDESQSSFLFTNQKIEKNEKMDVTDMFNLLRKLLKI